MILDNTSENNSKKAVKMIKIDESGRIKNDQRKRTTTRTNYFLRSDWSNRGK